MFPEFLPTSTIDIREPEAIALLQQMQRQVVQVRWGSVMTAIATAYVRYSPASATFTSAPIPIVLLHGFDSSLLEFRRLLPLLAKNYETWAVDLFGNGFTEYCPSLPVNPHTIRQHLLNVLETWICQPVILVGASLGGAVAIDFELYHPDWVRSLILINSVGFSGGFPIGQFLPQPLIELGADWLYFRKQVALTAASTLPMLDPTLIDALRCASLHQNMPGWKAAITSFTQSGGYANLGDRLTEIHRPTLVLWGEADDVLGTVDATRFEQAISDSQLIWIQQAGHVPHIEQPQAVATHLSAFIQRAFE
jgi:pimeloyl-ACP methyl ester carboxylesterase